MTESTAWIRKIIVIAVLTRLVVLSVGIATFCLIPSWDTSQTLRPSGEAGLAGGIRSFVNWDGEYFLHVSKHGYTNEKLHAFFPGLPVAIIVVKEYFMETLGADKLLATYLIRPVTAILFTNLCHVLAAVILFKLTDTAFQNKQLSYAAAVMFCFNPAGVFFSAGYTESPFALFSFLGFWYLENARQTKPSDMVFRNGAAMVEGSVFFAVATFFRSNGILYIGFFLWLFVSTLMKRQLDKRSLLRLGGDFISLCFPLLIACIVTLAPFVAFQFFGYFKYCGVPPMYIRNLVWSLPTSLKPELLTKQPSFSPPWCLETKWHWSNIPQATAEIARALSYKDIHKSGNACLKLGKHILGCVPNLYGHIQKTYWGNGFLGYWQLAQVPNFLLATPVLVISFLMFWQFLSYFSKEIKIWTKSFADLITLNVLNVADSHTSGKSKNWRLFLSSKLVPYVVLNVAMAVFCLFFMHVQVCTRFLSANPVIYWWLAYSWVGSRAFRLWLSQYLSLFLLIGPCLFVNYFPWT